MSASPRFSVVVPTHDRDATLREALASVFAQTERPLEVIVVDDLARPETERCVRELARGSAVPVELLSAPSRGGVSRAYNLGAQKARGDYLAFLDDDDRWAPGYLARARVAIEEDGVPLVLTDLTEFDDGGRTRPGKRPPDAYRVEDFYLKNPGALRSNLVVRRALFHELGGYDESIRGSSDKDLFMRAKARGCAHRAIHEPLVFWRTGHPGQASTDPRRILGNVVRFYRKYFRAMPWHIHLGMWRKLWRLFSEGYLRRR